jgi:hypothetical protein
VTLAAKVESKKGTEAAITAIPKNFEGDLPEPPKRDFTLPLNGEFNDILAIPFYCGRATRLSRKNIRV